MLGRIQIWVKYHIFPYAANFKSSFGVSIAIHKTMFILKIKQLYILFILLLSMVVLPISAHGIDSCRDLLHITAYSHLSPEAKRTLQLLERKIHPAEFKTLQRRWARLDLLIGKFEWEKFYADVRQLTPAEAEKFSLIQKTRMSSSTTISGTNMNDRKADQAEINWLKADNQVHDWVSASVPMTIERIFELNKIIGVNLYFNGNQPGRRRTGAVGVTYSQNGRSKFQAALAVENIEPLLKHFMNWYNASEGKMHPIHLAAQVYQRLNTIHPFPDGNGRTTRLIMDWVLRTHGYPPSLFLKLESTFVVIFPDDQLGRNPTPGLVEDTVTVGLEWVENLLHPVQADAAVGN